MRLRAAALGVFVILSVGAAVSAAGLLQIDELRPYINGIPCSNCDLPEPGKPQTIMILGTDGRLGADAGGGSRSDTIILAHLDAGSPTITLTSIPRDLKVNIPGQSYSDKINAAYAEGGIKLTIDTVKALFSRPGEPFQINHVVTVNFEGFRKLVDYLGCTYTDIDRHYFNDVGGPGGYAVIDIDAGYQKLCGVNALAYVRYRHADSDLVRASRQQDFIRQMLRQPGVRDRLNYSKRKEVAKIAGEFTRVDNSLRSTKQLFTLFKLGLNVAGDTIQQVPFGAGELNYEGAYLTASKSAIDKTREQFLHPVTLTPDAPVSTPSSSKGKKKHAVEPAIPPGLHEVGTEGEDDAIALNRTMRFPFYYPTLGTGDYTSPPRVYQVNQQQAYRLVVPMNTVEGEYYGIQGMKWQNPPLLDGPHDTVTYRGRHLDVYYDGSKPRLVAWRTKTGVYYVSNTLDRALSRTALLAIARSLKTIG
ncbi:MAG: polyisoprenyl-teichoic acid--peptidoglycan teichoic acid transferase [Solirubrobacteraceae bacterium]|jgi:LCP family protein required for cell wall assembly|nr:polyisoprenyl-teichoic acid--peptidoglycan teichoic acid transferase [Solirubrobacteraceae bacterium]